MLTYGGGTQQPWTPPKLNRPAAYSGGGTYRPAPRPTPTWTPLPRQGTPQPWVMQVRDKLAQWWRTQPAIAQAEPPGRRTPKPIVPNTPNIWQNPYPSQENRYGVPNTVNMWQQQIPYGPSAGQGAIRQAPPTPGAILPAQNIKTFGGHGAQEYFKTITDLYPSPDYDPDIKRAFMWMNQNQQYLPELPAEQPAADYGYGGGGYYPYGYGGGGGGGGRGYSYPDINNWYNGLMTWRI